MSALPPDPTEALQSDALERQLRGLEHPVPEGSVARLIAQDIAWARLLTPPPPAESVAHFLAVRIGQEVREAQESRPQVPVLPQSPPVPQVRRRSNPLGVLTGIGALALLLSPTLLPGAGTLASGTWAALGLTSPLLWGGVVWDGLLLAMILALFLSGLLKRWRPAPAARWTGSLLLVACLLPLLLNGQPALPGTTTQVQSLLGREQIGPVSPLPWPLLIGLVALFMLIRWPTARALRFTPALARGVVGLGLAGVGTLALLRLNLKGLGLGGLLLTALSLLVGLSVALRTLGQQLLARLRWPPSRLMEAAFGLGGFALLTLEPRVAAPAALLGGVWGLGQLLSPAGAARPVVA